MLVSYAVGAMLAAAFFEVLPHALLINASAELVSLQLLLGLLLFFLLEKLVIWRHCHGDACEVHALHGEDIATSITSNTERRGGAMMLIGDVFHNFIDGVLMATAFLVDLKLGIITAVAIVAHKIPQEIGDFLVLLHAGYTRLRALMLNLTSSMATLLGGVVTYFALHWVQRTMPWMLSFAAASLIYVALADIIPSLHKRTERHVMLAQVLLIILGVMSVWLVHVLM